jgi:hypothetical protein
VRLAPFNLDDLVDELESDVALSRRLATGILDGGDRLRGVRLSNVGECCASSLASRLSEVDPLASSCWVGDRVSGCGCSGNGCNSSVTSLMVEGSATEEFNECEVLSKVGIPKPGLDALCSPTTSPKKSGRPAPRVGEDTFLLSGVLFDC